MKNKWFVSLLMVVVMMCACWTGALAEDEERETFTSGDYEYALLDDGTVEITWYRGDAEELIIPDTLAGKTVTAIGDIAFSLCYSLTTVTIPDSVTAIGDSAFYFCTSLTSVTIPDSVTAIGDSAFYYCKSLTSVTIPDSVEQIGMNPFAFCSALKTIFVSPDHPYLAVIDDVLFRKADKALISYPAGKNSSTYTIPRGIASIGDRAFYSCDSLTSVSISDSVTSIGDEAFSGCVSLTTVTIPDSVTAIGDSTFSFCISLTTVTIPDSIEQIGMNPFAACSKLKTIFVSPEHLYFATIDGALFRKADKALISYPAGISSSTYTIPQGITAIGDGAFDHCKSLTSVTIPDSVTSIGDWAFSSCDSLTLTVPRNSYAAEYAKTNNIPYTYLDANDWLNN